jgi:hypothetical protein
MAAPARNEQPKLESNLSSRLEVSALIAGSKPPKRFERPGSVMRRGCFLSAVTSPDSKNNAWARLRGGGAEGYLGAHEYQRKSRSRASSPTSSPDMTALIKGGWRKV